jgi:hypothetical protein
MGFQDFEKNIALLRETDFNLELCMAKLFDQVDY